MELLLLLSVQDIIDASILGASYSAQLTSQGAFCERLNGQADANLQQCFRTILLTVTKHLLQV